MSEEYKKEQVLRVDKLVIYAKEVDLIQEQKENDFPRRDPWGLFGRPRPSVIAESEESEKEYAENEPSSETDKKEEEEEEPRGPRWI